MNPNQGQTEAWNGGESVHYVSHADRYDRQLAPFTEALLKHVHLGPNDTVLDIGCGCGVTTLQAARRARAALGVDISHPLVGIASGRAQAAGADNVEFVVADAQTHGFDDGHFDVIISQFGSMFFDDPEGAFTNLRRALAPRGRAAFITWQELEANDWLMAVGRAVERFAALPGSRGARQWGGNVRAQAPRRDDRAADRGGLYEHLRRAGLDDDPARRGCKPGRIRRLPARNGHGPRTAGSAGG
jgi:SAM-dependent methyltransferase